jgi:hypothetical protein
VGLLRVDGGEVCQLRKGLIQLQKIVKFNHLIPIYSWLFSLSKQCRNFWPLTYFLMANCTRAIFTNYVENISSLSFMCTVSMLVGLV